MAVYVDNATYQYRRMFMCHMIADTPGELLAMADTIGVDRQWIQYEGTYREHFDIAKGKRDKAIRNGAVAVTSRDIVAKIKERRIAATAQGVLHGQDDRKIQAALDKKTGD